MPDSLIQGDMIRDEKGAGTHSYSVATPRCVKEISELICASSCFNLRTRSLDTARSAFSSSGSYLELIEVVEEDTGKGEGQRYKDQ